MDKFTVTFEKKTYIDSDGNTMRDFFPIFEDEFQVTLPENLRNGNVEKQKKYCNRIYWDYYNTHDDFRNEILAKVKQEAADFKKDNPNLNYEYDEEIFDNAKTNNQVPPGRVWHHHETPGLMQLVREPIHRRIHHIGGYELWCKS